MREHAVLTFVRATHSEEYQIALDVREGGFPEDRAERQVFLRVFRRFDHVADQIRYESEVVLDLHDLLEQLAPFRADGFPVMRFERRSFSVLLINHCADRIPECASCSQSS